MRKSAVRQVARGWKYNLDTLAWLKELAQSNGKGAMRKSAVRELARGWKDDPEVLAFLKSLSRIT